MKVSGGLKENGIVVGNVYDKYSARNPIVRWLMRGFDKALEELVMKAAPTMVHEIGCGEGFWTLTWIRRRLDARGSDFSTQVIELARANAREQGVSPDLFKVRNIYDLEPGPDSADLIVCCELLEHLEHPEEGLRALQRVATNYVIISVPLEPIWCILNMARGKYLAYFGNTPGHIQHWSRRSLVRLVDIYFDVVEVRNPLPWTMLLCRVRH